MDDFAGKDRTNQGRMLAGGLYIVEDPKSGHLAPRAVQLLTPAHPVAAQPRRDRLEAAKPITIGENSVIGAVVTRDIPAGVVAVGDPARVIWSIDE